MSANNGIATGLKLAALAVCLSFLFSGALSFVGTDLNGERDEDNGPVQGKSPAVNDDVVIEDDRDRPAGWGVSQRGNDIFVPGSFWTIQEAVDAALPGDSIWVSEKLVGGDYEETVHIDVTVNITGIDPATVLVTDQGEYAFNVSAPYVNISGFGFRNNLGAVLVNNTNNTHIYDCIIEDDGGSPWGGSDVGIWVDSSDDIRINDTVFSDLSKGVRTNMSAGVTVEACGFTGGYSVLYDNTSQSAVQDCEFDDVWVGVTLMNASEDCSVHGNDISSLEDTGILVDHSDLNTIYENVISGGVGGNTSGIMLNGTHSTLMEYNSIHGIHYGMVLRDCGGAEILAGEVYDCGEAGIYLDNADGCTLRSDLARNGLPPIENYLRIHDISGTGIDVDHSSHLQVLSAVLVYDNDYGLYAHDSDNMTLFEAIFQENSDTGVAMGDCWYSDIEQVLTLNNSVGLHLWGSNDIHVDDVNVVGNDDTGVWTSDDTFNLTIVNSNITGNVRGIDLEETWNTSVENCTITNEEKNAEDKWYIDQGNWGPNHWSHNIYGDYMGNDTDGDFIGDDRDYWLYWNVRDAFPRTRVYIGMLPVRDGPGAGLVSFASIQAAIDYTLKETGLVSWWRMDDQPWWSIPSPFPVSDSVGGNDGSPMGGVWRTGRGLAYGAAKFDGSSDSIIVPDNASLDLSNEMTLESWVNAEDASKNVTIAGKMDLVGTDAGYMLAITEGALHPWVHDTAGGNYSFTAGTLTDDTWHHVALTWKTGGDLAAYIDGDLVGSIPASALPIGSTATPFIMGAAPWDINLREFDGRIDEVRLYDRELSADEIADRAMAAYGEPTVINVPGGDRTPSLNETRLGADHVQIDGYYFEYVNMTHRGNLAVTGEHIMGGDAQPFVCVNDSMWPSASVTGHNIIVSDMHFSGERPSDSPVYSGINVMNSTYVTVEECLIRDLSENSSTSAGIILDETEHVTVNATAVVENLCNGMYMRRSNNATVVNSTFSYNGFVGAPRSRQGDFHGLRMERSSNNTFEDSVFDHNMVDGVHAQYKCSDNDVVGCTASHNGDAGMGRPAFGGSGDGISFDNRCYRTRIEGCTADFNGDAGIRVVHLSHYSTIDDCHVEGNDWGIYAEHGIIPSITGNKAWYNDEYGIMYEAYPEEVRAGGGYYVHMYQFPVTVDVSGNDVRMYDYDNATNDHQGIYVGDVGSQRAPSGSGMWYSGTGREYVASMERKLDLKGYESPKLAFSYFYDLGDSRDFIFVNVSDDSTGERFYKWNLFMEGNDDEEGGGDTSPEWTRTVLDLTPWNEANMAEQGLDPQIWIRFQYVTDLFTEPDDDFGGGWWIDDIQVFDTMAVPVYSDDMDAAPESQDDQWSTGGAGGGLSQAVLMTGGDFEGFRDPEEDLSMRLMEGGDWSDPQLFADSDWIHWVETATNPETGEACMITIEESGGFRENGYGILTAYVFDGKQWDSGTVLSEWANYYEYSCADVAIESQSGDMMVAWGDDDFGDFVAYSFYKGGSWTEPEQAPWDDWDCDSVRHVELEADPTSDTIALVTQGDGDRRGDYEPVCAYIWDGTDWIFEGASIERYIAIDHTASKSFDLAFESQSGDLHLFVGYDYDYGHRYGEEDQYLDWYTWNPQSGQWMYNDYLWGGDYSYVNWIEVEADPNSDEMLLAFYTYNWMSGEYYLWTMHWDGEEWDDEDEVQIASPAFDARWFDIAWEESSGIGHVFYAYDMEMMEFRDGGTYVWLMDMPFVDGEFDEPVEVGYAWDEEYYGPQRFSTPSINWVDAECRPGTDEILVGALNGWCQLYSWTTSPGKDPVEHSWFEDNVYDPWDKCFDIFWLPGPTEPWEHGAAKDGPNPYPSKHWGVNLDGDYDSETVYSLTSPKIGIADAGFGGRVEFEYWMDVEGGRGDGGIVQVRSRGTPWKQLDPSGNSGVYDAKILGDGPLAGLKGFCEDTFEPVMDLDPGWERVGFYVPGRFLDGWAQFRFLFASDSDGSTADGWYVDNLDVYAYEKDPGKVLIDDDCETPDPKWKLHGPRWTHAGYSVLMNDNEVTGGAGGIEMVSCGETQMNGNTISDNFGFTFMVDANMNVWELLELPWGERGSLWNDDTSPVFEYELEFHRNTVEDNRFKSWEYLEPIFEALDEGGEYMFAPPIAQGNILVDTGFDSYLDVQDNNFLRNDWSNMQIWQMNGDTNILELSDNYFFNYSWGIPDDPFMGMGPRGDRSFYMPYADLFWQWWLEPGLTVVNGLPLGIGGFRDGSRQPAWLLWGFENNITIGNMSGNTFLDGGAGMIIMADGNVSADMITHNTFTDLVQPGDPEFFRSSEALDILGVETPTAQFEEDVVGLPAMIMVSHLWGLDCPDVSYNTVNNSGSGLSFRMGPDGETYLNVHDNLIEQGNYMPVMPLPAQLGGISVVTSGGKDLLYTLFEEMRSGERSWVDLMQADGDITIDIINNTISGGIGGVNVMPGIFNALFMMMGRDGARQPEEMMAFGNYDIEVGFNDISDSFAQGISALVFCDDYGLFDYYNNTVTNCEQGGMSLLFFNHTTTWLTGNVLTDNDGSGAYVYVEEPFWMFRGGERGGESYPEPYLYVTDNTINRNHADSDDPPFMMMMRGGRDGGTRDIGEGEPGAWGGGLHLENVWLAEVTGNDLRNNWGANLVLEDCDSVNIDHNYADGALTEVYTRDGEYVNTDAGVGIYVYDGYYIWINDTSTNDCNHSGVVSYGTYWVWLYNSTANDNGKYGIYASYEDRMWIEHYDVLRNGDGIYSDDTYELHISDCDVSYNDDDGIYADDFRGNVGDRGKGGPEWYLYIGDCGVVENGGDGIYLDLPADPVVPVHILNNDIENNGGWGLYVTDPQEYPEFRPHYLGDDGGSTLYGIATGDFDNDGLLDVVSAGSSGARVWRNTGEPWGEWPSQYFGDTMYTSTVHGVAVADFDKDGWLDVAMGDNSGYIVLWHNDGTPFDGTWSYSQAAYINNGVPSLAAADLDGDGWKDLVAGTWYSSVWVLKNDGTPFTGVWSSQSISANWAIYDIAVGDLDKDGDKDLAWCVDGGKVFVSRNDGTPFNGGWSTWEAGNRGTVIRSLDLGDLDKDGDLDIVTGDSSYNVYAWENEDTPWQIGWGQRQIGYTSWDVYGLELVDVQNDGWLDAVSSYYSGNRVGAHINDQSPFDGTWDAAYGWETVGNEPYSLAAGDFDGDGYMDFVTGHSGGNIHTWRSTPGAEQQYTGEWAVTEEAKVLNNPVYTGTLPMNVYDGGLLTINNDDVYMYRENELNVYEGGELSAYDTTFTSYYHMDEGRGVTGWDEGLEWNFTVRGNATLSDCEVVYPYSIYCTGSELVSITGTEIYHTLYDAVTLKDCPDVQIDFSKVHDPVEGHGIKAQDSSIAMEGTHVFSCTDGLNTRNSNLTVVESSFYWNERHGAMLFRGDSHNFEGSMFFSNGKDGLNARLCPDISFTDCGFFNNTRNGLFLSGCGVGEDAGGGNEGSAPVAQQPVIIHDCSFTGNDDGLTATSDSAVEVLNAVVTGNGDGLNVLDGSTADVDDSYMENTDLDFFVTDGSFCDVLNTPHTESKVTVQDTGYYEGTMIVVAWYIDFEVYDSGAPFAGANVSLRSPSLKYPAVPESLLTGGDGATDRFICVGYEKTIDWTNKNMNPVNVTVEMENQGGTVVKKYRSFTADRTKTIVIDVNLPPSKTGTIDPIEMWEDDKLTGVFNINSYFLDTDELEFTVTGADNLKVKIGGDGLVNISSRKPNWNGDDDFYIRATDTGNNWVLHTVEVTVRPVNDPPYVENATVEPAHPKTGDKLEAYYEWHDPDLGTGGPANQSVEGDAHHIVWYRDGEPVPAYEDRETVPSSATSRGEVWHFTIIPTDGLDLNGTMVVSGNVTIGNTAPGMWWPEVLPDEVYTSTDIIVRPSGWDDPDGDQPAFTYRWQVKINGFWEDVEGQTGSRLSHVHFHRDYQVRCLVTPFDGELEGQPRYTNATTVMNSPPSIESVVVSTLGEGGRSGPGTTATIHDVLIANVVGYQDPDGDPPSTFYYRWYKQDGAITGADESTLELSEFHVGDVFTVEVTPSDGPNGKGEAVPSHKVTVVNRPPTFTGVTLAPDEPSELDDILALPQGYYDPDGDPSGQPSFTWYIDSVESQFTGSMLPSSYTMAGQSVFVEVRPFDGMDKGPAVTSPTVEITKPLPDKDGDGIPDHLDTDIDGDEVLNDKDAFPYDADEYSDLDGDGTGDREDDDDDDDGVKDVDDDFPRDPKESKDTDKDGIGDNSDADLDGDGIPNSEDPDPNIKGEVGGLEAESVLPFVQLALLFILLLMALLMVYNYLRNRGKGEGGQGMANCSECGAQISMDATVCPSCGAEFEEGDEPGGEEEEPGEEDVDEEQGGEEEE